MKRKLFSIILIFAMTLPLIGCGFTQLNLTEQEEKAITTYMANLLLKYDKNHKDTIVDTESQRELEARVEAIKELQRINDEEALAEENSKDKKSNKSSGDSDSSSNEPELRYPPEGEQDIAKCFALDGIDISYQGYEVCQSYPNDGSEEGFFAMDATSGSQLVVFHFDVNNPSSEEKNCNILSRDAIFRIVVNDTDRKNALTTLLLNDLATIDETIMPGESKDAVIVLETDPGYEQTFETLSLLIKQGDEQSVIPIK